MPDDAPFAAGAPPPENPRPLVGLSIGDPGGWTRLWAGLSRRLGGSDIAARLARVRGLPDADLHTFLVSLHARRRPPMLVRFLDAAGIVHAAGHVDVSEESEPVALHRLVAAVEAITAGFPPEHVALYLDALGLEGRVARPSLATARAAAEKRATPGKESLSA